MNAHHNPYQYNKVYKFDLGFGKTIIELDHILLPLSMHFQDGVLKMWAAVHKKEVTPQKIEVNVVYTGRTTEDFNPKNYLGTCIKGDTVYHGFWKRIE